MSSSHTQPHMYRKTGAVEAVLCLRPFSPKNQTRRKSSTCGPGASTNAGYTGQQHIQSYRATRGLKRARMKVRHANLQHLTSTIPTTPPIKNPPKARVTNFKRTRGRRITTRTAVCVTCVLAVMLALAVPHTADARASISGTCYVACKNAHIPGANGGNVFEVTFPEYGITTTGYCISGSIYGTPLPGTYPFTGEPTSDGGFQITVNSRGAGMYDNHYSAYGAQNVGGFKIYPFASIEIFKHSAAPEVTDNNPCYHLDGAVYGVYDDEACTNEVLALTTDSTGHAQSDRVLTPGRYWVREKTAPEGYLLDPDIYPVDVAQEDCRIGAVPAAHVTDVPLLASANILVKKVDTENGVGTPQGDASLAGAIFIAEHYAGRYTSLEEIAEAGTEPTYTWQVATDAEGRATVGAGDLPENGQGAHGLPLGTVVIREMQAPEGYLLPDQTSVVCPVAPSPDDSAITLYCAPTFAEQVIRGDIAILKVGASEEEGNIVDNKEEGAIDQEEEAFTHDTATSLPGTTSSVSDTEREERNNPTDPSESTTNAENKQDESASSDTPANAETETPTASKIPLAGVAFDIVHQSTGEVVARLITDEDGRASTEDLCPEGLDGALPYGIYEVREDPTTTPPGYRSAEPFLVTVEEKAHIYCYEVVNELVTPPDEPPGDEPPYHTPPTPLVKTGDSLTRTLPCVTFAAMVSVVLAAALAARLRRQRL